MELLDAARIGELRNPMVIESDAMVCVQLAGVQVQLKQWQ